MTDAPVYLDNAATTPVDPGVVDAMLPWLSQHYGNPASNTHYYGWQAEEAVERAREQVAGLIGAQAREIIWTSGATESDNLAIKGAAQFYANKGKHIITVKTEHKAVLDTCRELERQGFDVTYLDVQENGLLNFNEFAQAIRPDTILASVMHVNNEIGVIQDIQKIGNYCREHNVLLHVDAAQSAGKLPIDLSLLPVDFMSFSGHKVYGPKGIGALYVRHQPRRRLKAQIHGGGHERGLRSGTLATHQIVGMGQAFALAHQNMETDNQRIKHLHELLWKGLSAIPGIYLNGDSNARVPHSINISVAGIEGEALIRSLRKIAVSSGSACTSATQEASYVLQAIGRSEQLAHASLRLTLGRFSTVNDVDVAIQEITQQVGRLRDISPLWEADQLLAENSYAA